MRKLLVVPALALVASLGLSAGPARADGGTYPSNAPTVTPGSTVQGGATTVETIYPNNAGKAGVQYYRVPMAFGDHLVVDFTAVSERGTGLCVFAPSVTDYTIQDADCLEEEYTSTTKKAQLQYIAPGDGAYLLAVHSTSYTSWAYSMIVNVLHSSSVSASGPSSVAVGRKIRITGQASVAGSVTLQLKAGGWKTVDQAGTKSDGSFKLRYKPSSTGRHKFRVLFAGPPGYLGSMSSKVKVQVRR